jgi:hypothetical protein
MLKANILFTSSGKCKNILDLSVLNFIDLLHNSYNRNPPCKNVKL